MASRTFAIDIGTDSIKIYRKGTGLIYFQKTVLAEKNKKKVIAVGNDAYEIFGKAPDKIEVTFPLKNGVIASINSMQSLINCVFLDLSKEYGKIKSPRIYIAVSADITDIEKKAFYDIMDGCFVRPKSIIMIDKPVADAIGCGIDFYDTKGSMIVDIGAETTEISVVSAGTLVLSKLFKFGGHDIDEAIINTIRRKFNILIGLKTAEQTKRKTVALDNSERECKLYGRDVVSGLPRECKVDSAVFRDNVIEQVNPVVDAIKSVLERTPPEISADIYRNGVVITGGTSKIPGIADLIEDGIGLKIKTVVEPTDSVINGLSAVAEGRITL